MAEKMLTNWFAFLLHKFLKVRRDRQSWAPAAALPSHPHGLELGLQLLR